MVMKLHPISCVMVSRFFIAVTIMSTRKNLEGDYIKQKLLTEHKCFAFFLRPLRINLHTISRIRNLNLYAVSRATEEKYK